MGAIDHVNQLAMGRRDAVAQYAAATELSPPERAALAELADEVRGRPVMDLGVGGGRTIEPLRALSHDYLGIDYSEAMVAAARAKYPGVAIDHADACDLSRYPADHFALVLFSCNGIGMVAHSDRLRILDSVRRVLRPGGAFVFSNHNRRAAVHHELFAFPALELATNPLRSAVRAARFARETAMRVGNRWRNLRHETATRDYAIVNGASHHYGVMLYLIDLEHQRAQLARAGFTGVIAFDLSGARIAADSLDDSILYVARK